MRFPTTALRALGFALTLALAAAPARADLREKLGVFFELGEQDSVTAVTQKSATALEVETVDMTTTERKTLQEEVGAKAMGKLLEEAKAAGISVTEWKASAGAGRAMEPAADSAKPSDVTLAAEPAKPGRSTSSQRKNRMWYIGNQVPLSTYIFGFSIPQAFEVESPRVQIATPMLIAPVAFGAHLWFAKSRTFEDAHYLGTRYLSLSALYASYALPFALMDEGSERFRTATIISLAAYPLGIWGGYELGNKYIDLPGRIETQSKFALGFGIMGFFSPFLYFENVDDNMESIMRLGLGQSIAFGTAGHFMSSHYRTGENIPGGVTTGILSHAALGAGLGAEVAALADASTVRPWLGAAMAGGTIGFMEGLWFFRNRYDSNERGFYNLFGAGGGMLMGGGFLYLMYDEDASDYAQKVSTMSLLLGGALVGYIATDLLTSGMEDRPASGPQKWTDRLAFNPIPFPEPQVRDQQLYYRYRIPGVTYRF